MELLRRAPLAAGMFIVLFVLCGCRSKLDMQYGRSYGASVNGVRVFFDLLRKRGHRVSRCHSLEAQSLKRADTAIILQRFPGMDDTLREWFDSWLKEKPGRTVVFVSPGADAGIAYWSLLCEQLKEEEQWELLVLAENHRQKAEQNITLMETLMKQAETLYPYIEHDQLSSPPFRVPISPGDPLAMDVTEGKTLRLRFHPSGKGEDTSDLLSAGGRPFAQEKCVDKSRIIIVANAEFMLNYALLDHDNRILLVNVADHISGGERVCFVEGTNPSCAGGQGKAGFWSYRLQNPFAFLRQKQLLFVVLHWLVVGILFLAYKAPIFGRPRTLSQPPRHRFSKHIEACGRLLERSGDQAYAEALIAEYRHRHAAHQDTSDT